MRGDRAGEERLRFDGLGEGDWRSLRAWCGHALTGRVMPTPGAGAHQWGHHQAGWSVPGVPHALPERVPAAAAPPGERLRVLPLLCERAGQARHQQGPQQQNVKAGRVG